MKRSVLSFDRDHRIRHGDVQHGVTAGLPYGGGPPMFRCRRSFHSMMTLPFDCSIASAHGGSNTLEVVTRTAAAAQCRIRVFIRKSLLQRCFFSRSSLRPGVTSQPPNTAKTQQGEPVERTATPGGWLR
jgi:hypothetical protein